MSRNADIVAHFTRTADAFASAPPIVDRQALDLLLEQTGASRSDNSLDVACGPGVVACHFASVVNTATGIDITPAMIEKAKSLQKSRGLNNVRWDVGDVKQLPYAAGSFSIVTSRYALHHIPEPELALREMVRVCQAGGVVAVADMCVAEDIRKADRFNELERLNDPTHIRGLRLSEHLSLFRDVGLTASKVSHYKLDFPLLRMLEALGRSREEALAIEQLVQASIKDDMLGTNARVEEGESIFSYPIAVLSARKFDGAEMGNLRVREE
jgi:SAM-dependent methyltransferase